ncbi:hypothetical protein Tco_1434244, partial [Tanacetum coccineum]
FHDDHLFEYLVVLHMTRVSMMLIQSGLVQWKDDEESDDGYSAVCMCIMKGVLQLLSSHPMVINSVYVENKIYLKMTIQRFMFLFVSPDHKEMRKTISRLEYGAKAMCIVCGPHTPIKAHDACS